MQSRRSISGTLLAVILVLLHFFAMIALSMNIPFESKLGDKVCSRISMSCLLYGFFQTFYILLRPSFSAPCSDTWRLMKTGGFVVSAGLSALNLILSVTAFRESCHEDVVQATAAGLALFHGGLYWAYTRMPKVFLPFNTEEVAPAVPDMEQKTNQ